MIFIMLKHHYHCILNMNTHSTGTCISKETDFHQVRTNYSPYALFLCELFFHQSHDSLFRKLLADFMCKLFS